METGGLETPLGSAPDGGLEQPHRLVSDRQHTFICTMTTVHVALPSGNTVRDSPEHTASRRGTAGPGGIHMRLPRRHRISLAIVEGVLSL